MKHLSIKLTVSFFLQRGKETVSGLFTGLFYSLKPIAFELFVEKHRLRLRELFSDHHTNLRSGPVLAVLIHSL